MPHNSISEPHPAGGWPKERRRLPVLTQYAGLVWGLTKEAIIGWRTHRESRVAAALAFYALFSIAPGLIIVISVASWAIGEPAARDEAFATIQNVVGAKGAEFAIALSDRANREFSGTAGTLIGLATVLFGASVLFSELLHALNEIWNVVPKAGRVIRRFLYGRIIAFVMVILIGILLGFAVAANALLSGLGELAGQWLQVPHLALRALTLGATFCLMTLIFAAMFKFLPRTEIAWGDVWVGAAVTALLSSAGNYLIGVYLGRGSIASVYGAAGSLFLVLLWVFYSFRVFLLGAKFTEVYSRQFGSRA
jgi:membrane protein